MKNILAAASGINFKNFHKIFKTLDLRPLILRSDH